MNDKLKLLLEQINMSLEYYSYFNDGKLDKIVGNKSKDTYTFFIVLKDVLPLNVYLTLYKLLKDTYNDFKVKIDVIYDNDNNHLSDYFNYTIDSFSNDLPLLEVYKDCCISAEDSLIKLEVGNKAELIKFESVKDKVVKKLKSMGFKDVNVEITINTSKYDDVKESITKDIDVKSIKNKINKKTESNIIMGEEIKTKVTPIKEIYMEENNIAVEALVFGIDYFESPKSSFKIITLKLHDKTDSIFCKMFIKDDNEYQVYKDKLKIGKWYKIRGYTKNDQYSKELVINARDINISKIVEEKIKDEYKEKRVELHAHTFMSQMDGMIEPKKLIKQAHEWGHKAIAVTDHSSVQSFPDVYHTVKDLNKGKETDRFKALYGVELVMIDDAVDIVIRENDTRMLDNTYVVFDFETTGFNAGGKDQIIEVGAVLLKDGKIIDKFSELIDPKRELPAKITEITGITDEMLKGMDDEETVIKRFIEWYKDYPMVAHNAKFDVSFLEMCYQKYKLGVFKNTVIDTLELSRTLDSSFGRHNLSALVKRYDIPFDEDNHHRGDYDAEATALVFQKMMKKMDDRNIEKISDIKKLVAKDEIFKFGRAYHINLIATNKAGLKNLFKLVSLASTKYLYKTPRIPRSEILDNKEGLLLGSGCYESEVFIQARSKSEEELSNIINFYDYIEVQPLDCYDHLLQMNDFATKNELIEHVKKIIRVTEDAGKIMVATGDVHHMTKEDKIYRQILVNQKVPGGGRHPLARSNIEEIPSNHFRTTDEMINDFSFIDSKLAHKIVIDNPNKIADLVEELEVIIETGGVPFSPKIENSEQIVKDLVYGKAFELYGEPLHEIVADRIEKELTGIIKGGFDVIYLISQKLVKKSNDDGYIVGSRGSVGSSFVATLMGITEVNPLSAHYRCPSCKHTIFEEDNVSLGSVYPSGFDLPNKECPKCNTLMAKDGQDMPFATFLGFDADKVPDIDLNFSGEYQSKAHEYTKELFGEDNVYRAGTIGTVADKTAYGFAKGYCEDKGIILRGAEVERLALGCTGVKRTTGQHPGGIVVVPDYMDVFDFTPFQYPADDVNSTWKTTHFDYHAIDQDLLKLDILGHDDPTILKLLLDATNVKVEDIPFDDPKVMSIFRSPEALGVTKDDINCETGTLGIPEFGTNFTINMLVDTQPETFAELTKLSGLSHGTDVWTGNAQDLIRKKVCDFKEVIGCRDDIMVYLTYNGLKPKDAFKIMEFVRKGKPSKEKEAWEKFKDQMKEAGIVDWYIDSCYKIKYMFPKAHAAAYVMSAFRIAWFKVYYPIHYYSAYFSIRSTDFDLSVMIKGKDAIKARITEILLKGKEATNKELDIVETLQIAQEATARGFRFGNIDLLKSHDKYFLVAEDERTLIPPFRALDGLGTTVAGKIIEERLKAPFLSVEDFQKRGKVSSTLIDKMRIMKILDDLDESSQLSLF